jgi:hypothetical protein
MVPLNLNQFWNEVLKVVPGSRITTVPKSYKTDRTIAIEPTMNVFLQLGVDGIIRRRLRSRWNYDLDDQKLNQDLARVGSENGSFATLDLSAASDTISMQVICDLIPTDWFHYLYSLRCHEGTYDGELVNFQKFSSMGNGYTFAIESLIFGSIVRWCYKKVFGYYPKKGLTAVYGDDLVVPTECASLVIQILELFGFSVNEDKSFVQGGFRESCGKDYFYSVLVRPVFLKRELNNVQSLYYLHNSLWDYQGSRQFPHLVDFSRTLRYLRQRIPVRFRSISGPPSEIRDCYLFDQKAVPVSVDKGARIKQYWTLTVKPEMKWKWKYSNFFFIKLMARLLPVRENPFSKHTSVGGNCFIITRRGHIKWSKSLRTMYY